MNKMESVSSKKESNMINMSITIRELYLMKLIGARTFNALSIAGIQTLQQLVDNYGTGIRLLTIRHFGRKALYEFTTYVFPLLPAQPVVEEVVVDHVAELLKSLSPLQREYLQLRYENMIAEMLDVRSQNVLRRVMPTFDKMMYLFDKCIGQFYDIRKARNAGRKTVEEIYDFTQSFKKVFEESQSMSDEEFECAILKNKYAFLPDEQLGKCINHKRTCGHLPMFLVLREFVKHTNNRSIKVYGTVRGIINGKVMSLGEVAQQMHITRERTRQLYKGTMKEQDLQRIVHDSEWGFYKSLSNVPILSENSVEAIDIINKEMTGESFDTFAWLANLLPQFAAVKISDAVVVMNKRNKISVQDVCDKLDKITSSSFEKETYISFKEIFGSDYTTFSSDDVKTINVIAEHFLKGKDNVVLFNDNGVLAHQNKLGIEFEIIKVLEERGEAMFLEDLIGQISLNNPEYDVLEKQRVRIAVYNSKKIGFMGKTGKVGLKNWSNVFFGTIREKAVEILANSPVPMHINDIFAEVTKYFKETNMKSLLSSLGSDSLERFVKYGRGFYGLSNKAYNGKFKLAI